MPYTKGYVEQAYPWLMGQPSPAMQKWTPRIEDVWSQTMGLPNALQGLREYAMGIRPEDYSQQYLQTLQASLDEALRTAQTQAASQAAARGVMYGTPTQEMVTEAMRPIMTDYEREMARAAMAAPELGLQAEQLRGASLIPYYQMMANIPSAQANILATLSQLEMLPEEQRRQFFTALMGPLGALSPMVTGWTPLYKPGILDRIGEITAVTNEMAAPIAELLLLGGA